MSLVSIQRIVEGSVKLLRCQACGEKICIFSFAGDDDQQSDRLCSASTCGGSEVALAEATVKEWSDLVDSSANALQVRMNRELGRDDLRVARFVRAESLSDAPAGTSFGEFRKNYRPSVLYFACPCCIGGEAVEVLEQSVAEFESGGGRLHFLDGLGLS